MSISDKLRWLYFRGKILHLIIGYENAGIKFYVYEPRYIYPEIYSVDRQYRIEQSPSWRLNIWTRTHANATFSVFVQFLRRVERPLIELLLYYLMVSSFKPRHLIYCFGYSYFCLLPSLLNDKRNMTSLAEARKYIFSSELLGLRH